MRYGKFLTEQTTNVEDVQATSDGNGITDEMLRAAGFYPIVEVGEPADSPFKIFRYTLVDDENGGHIEESYFIQEPAPPPYSKVKILIAAQRAGFIESLLDFIESDRTIKAIWDASNVIEDNDLLASYLPAISQALEKTPAEILAFLNENCIVD